MVFSTPCYFTLSLTYLPFAEKPHQCPDSKTFVSPSLSNQLGRIITENNPKTFILFNLGEIFSGMTEHSFVVNTFSAIIIGSGSSVLANTLA